MIPDIEHNLLFEQLGKKLKSIFLCSVKNWSGQVEYNESKTYFGFNLGCIVTFADETQILIGWAKDKFGDPYRVAVVDVNCVDPDEVDIYDTSSVKSLTDIMGQPLDCINICTYPSSIKTEATDGVFDIAWGIELTFITKTILCAALNFANPFRKGTQDSFIISADDEFNEKQKERFADYLGFYGEL